MPMGEDVEDPRAVAATTRASVVEVAAAAEVVVVVVASGGMAVDMVLVAREGIVIVATFLEHVDVTLDIGQAGGENAAGKEMQRAAARRRPCRRRHRNDVLAVIDVSDTQ